MRVCAWLAVAAALPTVLWRAIVGCGATLGTPAHWRAAEHIPGSGTIYVLVLSAIQLVAALLTLLLINHRLRLPRSLVATTALIGAAILAFLCVASAVNWTKVDPFGGAPFTGWALLCRACYAIAPLWPVFLIATTIGYLTNAGASADRRPSISR